jgi:phosphate-selective porin OprO/OprP
VDFAGDMVVLKDAFLRLTEIPVIGNFTVGHFKEPFSLDQLTGDAATMFMERSLADTMVPGRNPGMMISRAFLSDESSVPRMTYAAGLFRQEAIGDTGVADGAPVNSERGYVMTARVTGLPWFENGGERLLHLGLAYSIRGTNDDHSLRYRARPEAHWVQYRFLDTGSLVNIDHVQLLGAEAAAVWGPFSLQSEFVSSLVDFDSGTGGATSSRSNVCYNGFYMQGSYFLTPGDRRNYAPSTATFIHVTPRKNFRQDGGWGAVELATRFSYLDLDEDGLGGAGRGELRDWTLGVNWYLNPNVRVMANYILSMAHRTDTREDAGIFMMRFQVDF